MGNEKNLERTNARKNEQNACRFSKACWKASNIYILLTNRNFTVTGQNTRLQLYFTEKKFNLPYFYTTTPSS